MKPRDARFAWAALAALLALASVAVGVGDRPALDWRPTLALAEPWRAWTAAWVHFSALHLWANVAGAVVVGAFGVAAGVDLGKAVAWFAAWPLTQAALLARPDLVVYGGLSGVLHAGVAIAAWHLVARQTGRARWIGAAIAVGLAVKIASEAPFGPALRTDTGFDIAVAPFAHLAGAAAGLVCALLATLIRNHTRETPK